MKIWLDISITPSISCLSVSPSPSVSTSPAIPDSISIVLNTEGNWSADCTRLKVPPVPLAMFDSKELLTESPRPIVKILIFSFAASVVKLLL